MKKTLHSCLRFSLALLTIITATTSSFAQSTEKCLSAILHDRMMATDATYAATMVANENNLQAIIADIESGRAMPTTYRIPVVVHIIHLGEAVGVGTNISDAQVYSAIRTLNEAYRRKAGTEFTGAGVDTGIEFCLAQKDATGNPSTGILRVNGSGTSDYATNGMTTSGTTNEATIKALSKWNNTKYYNIWVVSEIDGNNGGAGVQGFAYFPGTSATYDGAVMMYNCFGYDPTGTYGYNLKSYTNHNKTLIHEMGHALNLYHTFEGDGTGTTCPTNTNCNTQGDRCCDIPPHMRSNSTCVADATVNTCLAGSTAVQYEHNYMDYSADVCTNMFTANQSSRMNATLATGGTRASLATAANLTACGCSIPVVLFSASPVNPCLGIPVQFTDESLNFPTSWAWTFTGGTPPSAATQNPTSSYNTAGTYAVSLTATSAASISGTLTKTAYITPVAVAGLPLSENFEAATFPPTGWTRVSGDAPSVAWGTDGIHQWERRPAAGNTGSTAGSAAMNMFNYNLIGPPIDNLIVKPVSLSGMTAAQMTFRVSYKNYNAAANYDSLKVLVSTDCGNTYNQVYMKFGTGLATNGALNTTFTPAVAADWRTETVSLNSYIGQTIIVKFSSYSNYGNNLYLDDVNITGTSGSVAASVAITSSDADNTICAGTSVTFTAAPTNGGSAPTYQWQVNGANVGTGGTTYTTTTLTTGQTVTCIMTSNLPGVTGSPATSNAITTTVNAVPATPAITTSSPDCEGQTISLNTAAVTGATYAWTGPATFTSAVQNPTRPTATLAMAGTYSLTVTQNGCTSATGTAAVVINAAPATPAITTSSPDCVGQTISLNTTAVTGATYAWTGPSAFTSAVQNPTRPTATLVMSGTYSLTVTVGGCTSAAGTAAVIVNATPATPVVTTNSPACIGQTISLGTAAVTSATYAWTGPSAFTSAVQNPTRPTATAAMAGTYSVTVTVGGCTSAVGTGSVVVNAIPATPTVTSSTPDCEGQTISLGTTAVTGATYAWTGPATFTSALRNPTRPAATVAMGGTYSVTVTVNGCTSAAGTGAVVVNPIPATPTASSNSPVCTGSTISLTTTAVTGATYAWTGPSAYTSAVQNPNRTGATAAMAGTYSLTVTVSGCASAAGTTAVAVNSSVTPTVSVSASPAGAICAGTLVTFTSTSTGGGTTPAYQWKVGAANVGTGTTYATTGLTNGQVVTCVLTSSSSCASPATATSTPITMTVNAIPATPAATASSPNCEGSTINLTTPAVTGATYAWSGPSAFTSTSDTPAIASATAAMAGTYSVTVTVNGCTSSTGTSAVTVTPTVTPAVSTAVSPAGSVCAGTAVSFTATSTDGGTTPTYQWQVNGSNAGTGATFNTAALADGDAVTCILSSNAVCASPATATSSAIAMTVIAPVNPVVTTAMTMGTNPMCSGQTVSFMATATDGGSSPTYQWQVNGANAGTMSVYTSSALNDGDVVTCILTSSAACANPLSDTSAVITMNVNPVLVPAVSISGSSPAICEGDSIFFTSSGTNGGTSPVYQWQVNSVNAGTGATFGSTTLNNGDAVTCILTSDAACASPATASSNSISVTVNPVPAAATITQSGSTLTSSSPTGNQWYQNGVLIPGATAQDYTYTSNGTYTVVVTSAGCSSAASAAYAVLNVGINEATNPHLLNVYPNPNEGIFTVSFSSSVRESYTVEITNALGQVVFREEMKDFSGNYSKQLSVEEFGKGVYMINLTNIGHETVKKIIVY